MIDGFDLADRLRSAGLGRLELEPARRFGGGSDDDALLARVTTTDPWVLAAAELISAALPVPPTVAAFIDGPFFRPPTSSRSFYLCPALVDGEGGPTGVLAFKGVEPAAADFGDLLADFRRAGPSAHNIAEHFVFEEHKVPGCLSWPDAVLEADRAAAFQNAHLSAYGTLARSPLPLFVFRHRDDVVDRAAATLRTHLSGPAMRVVEGELAHGLAAYVYYYPSPPIRVRDADFLLQGLPYRDRLLAVLREICDPDAVVDRWIQTFSRMLLCGFVPGSLASLHTGVCCQPQNACLDGGFVDLDSVTPFHELPDDTSVLAALQFSVDSLIDSVRTLVAGGADPTRAEGLDVRIDLHHLREFVLAHLRAAVDRDRAPGVEVDDRVRTYLTPPSKFADLVDRLGTYYSRPSALDGAAREYRGLMPPLLRVARAATRRDLG